MKAFKIHAVPVADMIRELADQMNTTFHQHFGEFTVQIPPEFGTGFIRGLNFPNGVGLVQYNCCFKSDIAIDFIAPQIHPLKFIYCAEGELTHRITNAEYLHELTELSHIIVASSSKNGHHITFKKGLQTRICSVEIDRKKYERQVDFELTLIDFEFYKLLADVNAINTIFHSGNYSLKIADIIREIDEFSGNDIVRTNFLGAKSLEILAQMLMQYEEDINSTDTKNIIRAGERKQIQKAVNYIQLNLTESLTVEEIAKEAGLNIQKLQEGFKICYDTTVNAFIRNKRLDLAVQLLKKGDYNVSEIVNRIGFSSRSHFAKIFRERYGIQPKSFMNGN